MCFCHNPYFNRWFSAIAIKTRFIKFLKGHNPYFNRWFSAIINGKDRFSEETSHNPYFNRWFSAIDKKITYILSKTMSQSLF